MEQNCDAQYKHQLNWIHNKNKQTLWKKNGISVKSSGNIQMATI